MTNHKFNTYEQLLADVTLNAGEKIINAAILFNTKHAYRECLFLLLIAQEELSKLILLPFASAADQINELTDTNRHKGPYFNHKVKQKIFTSFGLQNRSHEEIEDIKQGCLYSGKEKSGKVGRYVARDKDTHEELCHAIRLYIHLAVYNLGFAKPMQVSPEIKKIIARFTNNIFIPALKDIAPTVIEDAQEYTRNRNDAEVEMLIKITEGKITNDKKLYEVLTTSPFMYADMLSYALSPDDYKKYFKEITGMSTKEMVEHLRKYI